jgi:hypothetical protein
MNSGPTGSRTQSVTMRPICASAAASSFQPMISVTSSSWAAQRILDLLVDPRPAAIAERLAVAPIKTDLGGDQGFVPPNFLKRPADDFFRMTETVDRRRIDEVDATIDGATDCAD